MSGITDLGPALEYLPDVLSEYEKELEGIEKVIKIEGKLLEKANLEQASYQLYYDMKRIELRRVLKHLEKKRDKIRGQLFKSYTETYSRELSDRGKEKYIDNEESYLAIQELYLEVEELYEKFVAVMEAFKSRGYALSNITDARVNSLENTQL